MAEKENVNAKLKQVILRVRAPVFGAQSIEGLWDEHMSDILEIMNTSDIYGQIFAPNYS